MEKHRCKLCFRVFANGRAMGGHMRSHMAMLPVPMPPKVPQFQKFTEPIGGLIQHPSVTNSVEPELEKQYQANRALVPFVQDSESEAESSRNPTGKRSKRARKLVMLSDDSSPAEPVSSLSESMDAEDAALCLLELSKVKCVKPQDNQSTEIDSTSGSSGQDPIRAVYRCELCNKDFKSYQALGGHKANHKKLNVQANEANNGGGNGNGRTFECPFCFRVFGSGQAMGGHKKCHYNNGPKAAAAAAPAAASAASAATTSANYRDNKNQFDLNLPAPQFDEDDAELSTVSNADNFYSFK